ncbi:hypothetical protein [Piscinibacter sakaiensis]|uniref:Methyltransferase type 11 domain-containing protein n=1 Tax=Piscinibacter sakaiensis TaxID=1547922 RepID=A0A0K8NTY9_PISS1|nr:hypothetical protein [Piscinibacter sakaiensis]GAP33852.1 hypothetical protein ISF6_1107 [Piscinibacter sakaiensis]
MGIDLHNLHLLAHAQDLGVRFERTLTIGRQALFVDPPDLAAFQRRRGVTPWPGAAAPAGGGPVYAEAMLQAWFGARELESVDASAYEQATRVHDMNRPWADGAGCPAPCDAVLDFGCLEHVFDFPTAWRNVVDACRVGGHVLHALPMNNLSGHGFYQFSPELFFNLYQPARGFELRGVYAATKAEPRRWWAVADPQRLGRRVTLRNGHEVYLLVIARKLREPGPLPAPQQSDYAQQAWVGGDPAAAAGLPARPRRAAAPLAALGLLGPARRLRERLRALRGAALALPAPDYTPVALDRLVGPRRPMG